jgi:putative endonuclease
MHCAVYILTNRHRTVLYVGVTSNLSRRITQHRARSFPSSFASRYNLDRLVYFEVSTDIRTAIAREKEIKGWTRRRKEALIEASNPEWRNLAGGLGE